MVDQIVQHLHLGRQGEPSRITLKLHPEELGQVKLELVMEKEGMRAHLQAQSQQVQEVMERHLPRLRDALEQQGLKLHDLRVSVDSQGDGGRSQFQGHQRHAQSGHFSEMPAPSGETGRGAEDLPPFHQHPMRSRPGGVNLMV